MRHACCAPTNGGKPSPASDAPATECMARPPLEDKAPGEGRKRRIEQAVLIEGGTYLMGSDDPDVNPLDGEGPIRQVTLPSFRIDPTAVTNADFADFISDTGYITEAERFGWSFVFTGLLPSHLKPDAPRVQAAPWWHAVSGARWDQPEGPGSSITERLDHPVVHIAYTDALAFAQWCGMRLPTEAEWEYAARGGLNGKRYAWGDDLTPSGEHRCNIWQGTFPTVNTEEDGFLGTAPVKSFPPNGYGLYEVAGNVWEWCSDYWGTSHSPDPVYNPQGPATGTSRVMKGGSYLCHRSYCNRYRVAARTSNTPDSSGGNNGFRCAADA